MANTSEFGTVTIVGVGLIGASIGMALRRRKLAQQVVGVGRRKSTLDVALQRGAIDTATTDLENGVADAELIVVCTPVDDIVRIVRSAAAACPDTALITDAGSTKADIVARLEAQLSGARFLGSHPMAGSEQRGPEHAQADLLDGRTVILTPTERSEATDCRKLSRFWTALGAHVVEMSPVEHDRHVAAVSHVPHLVASALVAATSTRDLPYVAAGWLDTTRVASGDEQLWTQIVRSNSSHVLKSLTRFETLVAKLREAIQQDDERQLMEILKDAKRKRDAANNPES